VILIVFFVDEIDVVCVDGAMRVVESVAQDEDEEDEDLGALILDNDLLVTAATVRAGREVLADGMDVDVDTSEDRRVENVWVVLRACRTVVPFLYGLLYRLLLLGK
jgi:hypothetical protein